MAGPKDTTKSRANMQARNEARYQKRLQQALEAREQLKGKVSDEWLELPPSRRAASEAKVTRFFDGIPCKQGHVGLRDASSGGCIECARKRQVGNEEKNAKQRKNNKALWADPERRAIEQERQRAYRETEAGKEAALRGVRKWREANREAARAASKKAIKERSARDPIFRLRRNLQSRLGAALRNQNTTKDSTTMKLVGCTLQHLVSHLEEQFTEGMTWENYGEWHVDHIRPCASFDLSDEAQRKECFNWKNLQPLWGLENIQKGDQWEEP